MGLQCPCFGGCPILEGPHGPGCFHSREEERPLTLRLKVPCITAEMPINNFEKSSSTLERREAHSLVDPAKTQNSEPARAKAAEDYLVDQGLLQAGAEMPRCVTV